MPKQRKAIVTRRDAIRWSMTGATGAALLGLSASSGASQGSVRPAEAPSDRQQPSQPATTTLQGTVVLGARRQSELPYRRLTSGPALATKVREDLCGRGIVDGRGRTALAAFGHLTDAHVLDAANPGRLSFLWQYFDFSEGFSTSGLFRPQDLLTVHVLDATVRKLNDVGRGPILRRPLDCLVMTGDLTNSFAVGELSAAVGVFKGASVSSHPVDSYKGVQDQGPAPNKLFKSIWHPEPETSPQRVDDWKALYGYPTVPGFLEEAVKPVAARGSDVAVYLGLGNHDEAGRSASDPVSAKTDLVDTLRLGEQLPLELPPGMDESEFWNEVSDSTEHDRQTLLASMSSRTVSASKLRRPFSNEEFLDALTGVAPTSGPGQLYYTFDISSRVIGVMLNTASPDGGGEAVMDATQAKWLEEQLKSVSGKFYDSDGKLNTGEGEDRLVVLFSHHPISDFRQEDRSVHDDKSTLDREAVIGLVSRFPNVVAWLNGHIHKHRVTPHKARFDRGGFWEITTASLIDFPQQSRIVEVINNGDGTLSIVATLVDHSTPESVLYQGSQSPASLAALSLELVLNRPGLDRDEITGAAEDQNVDLLLRNPFDEDGAQESQLAERTATRIENL